MSSSPSSISFIKMANFTLLVSSDLFYCFSEAVIVYSSQKDEPHRITHCASSTGGKEKEVVCVSLYIHVLRVCTHVYF